MKDTAKFTHPKYLEHIEQINMVYDVYNGIDNSKQYIYKMERESELSIETRKANATLKNFVKRATEAFTGMIFRKPIETTMLDEQMVNLLKNIDKHNNLNRFARDLSTHLILGGECFLAVDSTVDGDGLPYAIIYDRRSVINWRQNELGEYTLVVIAEIYEEYGDFSTELKTQYRVYTEDGNVNIYRDTDSGDTILYKTIETEYDYIPIIKVTLDDTPPLYDIAKMTIKHLNRTSIKDKYLNMAATPVPLIWGIHPEDNDGTKPVFVVGADEAFLFNGTKDESDFQWRELSGNSIDKLQEDLEVIEEDITSGIIRAAASDSTTIKTATQSFYEAAESANRVVIIANAVEQALNKMLDYLYDISNIEKNENSSIIVNKDFNAVTGNPQDMRLLWEVYLGGGLSIETFLDALSKHEIITIPSVRDEIIKIEQDKFVPKPKEMPAETKANMDNNTISVST